MNFKAAFGAALTGAAVLLMPACGGDADPSQAANPGEGSPSAPQSTGVSVAPARYVAVDLTGSYAYALGHGIGDREMVGGGSQIRDGFVHALLWRDGTPGVGVVDLHPQGFAISRAVGTSGGVQVGYGSPLGGGTRALKWTGAASTVVDLDPGRGVSQASGVSGDQIVGSGQMGDIFYLHALLWTSHGIVDLNPNGFPGSIAYATDGVQQVGSATTTSFRQHALLWSGTAESAIDLHPSGYEESIAFGVSGGQQVGQGLVGGRVRALLWTGSANSAVDLHPAGFDTTAASAVAAGRQVGYGRISGGGDHALLWSGTADSVVDLHVFLPPGFSNSHASGIDSSGNVIGTADSRAILWVRQ